MQYRKYLEIEQRLDKVLKLIRRGQFSATATRAELGVPVPTISRCVQPWRERGHEIRSEAGDGGWRYMRAGQRQDRKEG